MLAREGEILARAWLAMSLAGLYAARTRSTLAARKTLNKGHLNMSHATRHALRTITMSADTMEALDEISAMFSPDATLAHDDLDGIDWNAFDLDLDVAL